MRRSTVHIALVVLALASQPAFAQDFNGSQLKNFCETTSDKIKTATCFAFIKGSVDTYLILSKVRSVTKPIACLPANASVDLLRRVYVAWSRKNAAALSHSAADALLVSWRMSFPCR